MDAPFRIIGKAFPVRGIIDGIGMPGRKAVANQGVVLGPRFVRLLALQAHRHIQRHLATEFDHNYRIGGRYEVFGLKALPIPAVSHRGGGVGKIQGTVIVCYFPLREAQQQLAQRLVGLTEVSLQMVLKLIGLPVILLVQGLPYPVHPLGRLPPGSERIHYFIIRVLRSPVRLSRPEGNIVQGDAVFHRAAIDQGAQFAVSQGQGFLEKGGRTVVVKQERLLLTTGQACKAKGPAGKYGSYFHILGFRVSGALSTLQVSPVKGTWRRS